MRMARSNPSSMMSTIRSDSETSNFTWGRRARNNAIAGVTWRVPKLIEVARSNKNPAVRKQAMFWLGQSRDPRALEFFQEVLARP